MMSPPLWHGQPLQSLPTSKASWAYERFLWLSLPLVCWVSHAELRTRISPSPCYDSVNGSIYTVTQGKRSTALKPSGMAAASRRTEEDPSHMATSQTRYQSLPTHLTGEPVFTSAPIISEQKSDVTLWHNMKYSPEAQCPSHLPTSTEVVA